MMSIMRNKGLLGAAFAALLSLSACGGGNDAPVAIITMTPEVVTPGAIVSLSGADSFDPGGSITTYAWSQTAGQATALSAQTGESVTFTVPNATTTLTFALVVTDTEGKPSLPATIDIAVTANASPLNPSGNAPLATYVSAATGSDAPERDGGADEPVATIVRGIELAVQQGYDTVYVMEGTYDESIAVPSGIELVGCVAGADAEGKPIFAASPAGTIIRAPAGAEQAVSIAQASEVRVSCFTIVGGSVPAVSRAILIDGASQVALEKLSVTTPGAAGGICRDVDAVDSSLITVANTAFRSGGHCDDYTGIVMENVSASNIASGAGDVTFTMASGGSEKSYKGAELLGGSNIAVEGAVIRSASDLPADAVFTGVVARDVAGLAVLGNSIEAGGGMQSTGVSLRCTDLAFAASVAENDVVLSGASFKSSGVRITCAQPAGAFDIERNFLSLTPASGQAAKMYGVDVNGTLMQLDLSIVNNAIVMPTIVNDDAAKTGIVLSKLAGTSSVDARHNTILVSGDAGALYALSSDRSDVRFRNINNIFLIYGAGATNAVYSLPSGCETSYCAQVIIANLVNRNFAAFDLPLAYYYDTAQFVPQAVANECMQGVPPPQCTAHEVSRKDNVFQSNMKPDYFDFADGTLMPLRQVLAIDKGFETAGVTDDIDNDVRSDGKPDIGAHEY